MTSQISESNPVARRYAAALIDMAEQYKAVETVEKDIQEMDAMIAGSEDLQAVISNPLISREQQMKAMAALADRAEFHKLTKNCFGVLVENGRLSILPVVIKAVGAELSRRRGEVAAEIRTAHALSVEQTKELQLYLSQTMGKNVTLDVEVDKNLLGGMVVTVGSRMIDDSVQSKLERLGRAMGIGSNSNQQVKEVG